MTARSSTKFQLDDNVRIVGPASPPVTSDFTGHTGTVADMWEAFAEYIVVIDGMDGAWIYPESSLEAAVAR